MLTSRAASRKMAAKNRPRTLSTDPKNAQIFGSWQLKVEFPSAPRPTMPEGQHRRGEIPLPPELQGILRGDD